MRAGELNSSRVLMKFRPYGINRFCEAKPAAPGLESSIWRGRFSQNAWLRYTCSVKRLRFATACVVLASFFGVPVMACMTPAAQLTAEEKSCCEQMQGKCDDMGMANTSHSCCQPKANSAGHPYVAQARIAALELQPSAVAILLAVPRPALAGHERLAYLHLYDPSPPPGSATISILRI